MDAEAFAPARRRVPVVLVVAALVIAVTVLLPIAYLGVRATDRGWEAFEATLWRPRTLDLIGRSVTLTVIVTSLSTVIGVIAAWLVTRTDLYGRRVWRVVLALPLAMPSYIAAWAWIAYRPDLAGLSGAVLVLVTVTYPFVYLSVLAALSRADPAIEEVARSLGARGPAVFFTITLRQARIGIIGGALLAGLYTVSEFGAVRIMRYETLTNVIYHSYNSSFDRTPAAVLGCVLVAMTVIPILIAARFSRDDRVAKVGSGSARRAASVRLGWWQVPVQVGLVATVLVGLGVPAWNLLRWNERGRSVTDWSELWGAATTTLWFAGLAALAAMVLAVPLGILSARHGGRLSQWVTTAAYTSHSLPGIVVALSLVFFGVRFARPLYQQTPMLIYAYVVLFLSLAIAAVHNAIAQAPPAIDDVARSLGRSQWAVWRTVLLPVAAPGIATGAALVFLAAMKELPASLLLRPIGTDTLATRLWSHTAGAQYSAAAPYAAVLVLLAAVPTAVLTATTRLSDR